jgi:uncharacterized protein (DUF983 family)
VVKTLKEAYMLRKETAMKKRTAMLRGFKGQCPKCNQAQLFRAYLKPVHHCAHCEMEWDNVRADDGPAWATMLVVGHLLAPFFHFLIFHKNLPDWAPAVILGLAATILSLILLPRMKGLFIGLVWVTGAPTSTSDVTATSDMPLK